MTEIVQERPTASTCLAQLVQDLGTLSQDYLEDMIKGMELDQGLSPVDAVKKHLTEHPARLPQFMALLIREISYGPVLEPFEIVEGDAYFTKHAEAVLKCLGPVRTFCCIAGLQYLRNGERSAKGFYAPLDGAAAAIDPLPEDKAVEFLAEKLNDELLTVGSLLLRDDTKATQLAQLRAVKAEKELKDAQLKWAKVQERMNEAAVRAKKKAAEEAAGAAGKADQAKLEKVEKERDEAEAVCKKALAELKAAKDKDREKGKGKGGKSKDQPSGGGLSAGGPSAGEFRTIGDLASISAYCTHGQNTAYSVGGATSTVRTFKGLEELGEAEFTNTSTRPCGYTAQSRVYFGETMQMACLFDSGASCIGIREEEVLELLTFCQQGLKGGSLSISDPGYPIKRLETLARREPLTGLATNAPVYVQHGIVLRTEFRPVGGGRGPIVDLVEKIFRKGLPHFLALSLACRRSTSLPSGWVFELARPPLRWTRWASRCRGWIWIAVMPSTFATA